MSVTIHVQRPSQISICWEIKGLSLYFVEIVTIWFIMQHTGIQVLSGNGRAKILVPVGQLLTQLELNKDFPPFPKQTCKANSYQLVFIRKLAGYWLLSLVLPNPALLPFLLLSVATACLSTYRNTVISSGQTSSFSYMLVHNPNPLTVLKCTLSNIQYQERSRTTS